MAAIAQAIWSIFCEYGTPRIIQSDNGTEFVNQLMQQLMKTYAIDHRLITAYHPRANGLVERTNKEASNILKKVINGATQQWQLWLPAVQLALNTRVQERTNSTPFAIVHGRTFNGFEDFSKVMTAPDMQAALDNAIKNRKDLREIIYPGLQQQLQEYKQKQKTMFDKSHKTVPPFEMGDVVWAMDPTRTSKWDPLYEGPFTVSQIHKGGSYTLKDQTGEDLQRRVTTSMLKRDRPMEDPSGREDKEEERKKKEAEKAADMIKEQEYFRVSAIVRHHLKKGKYEYLVHWHGYDSKSDSWVSEDDFTDTAIVRKYWHKHADVNKEKKSTQKSVMMKTKK